MSGQLSPLLIRRQNRYNGSWWKTVDKLSGAYRMKIGLVGYQGSGKSTLFSWLTGVEADPSLAHTSQAGMATVPEPRVGPLCEVYAPKKVTWAALELVDTPGLDRKHAGNASKLSLIREANCLIQVDRRFRRRRSDRRLCELCKKISCWPIWRSSADASSACASRSKRTARTRSATGRTGRHRTRQGTLGSGSPPANSN